MFLRRKGWLRNEFDEKLVSQINRMKNLWDRYNSLNEQSYDPFGEMEIQTKITKAKYLYLLREAKKRNISVLK